MAIFVDPVITHGDSNTGNDTLPPGITADEEGGWTGSHIVSDGSEPELRAFLDDHAEIGQPSSNVRAPAAGSLITYAGLDATMRAAAVAAGATEGNKRFVVSHAFDSNGGSLYEPLAEGAAAEPA